MQFVVDAQGCVAPSSIELVRGEDILFAEVVRVLAQLPQWEYPRGLLFVAQCGIPLRAYKRKKVDHLVNLNL